MESERRLLHNVNISTVDNAGGMMLSFSQFTDAKGVRHMLGRPVHVKVSGKSPLLLVIEEAHAAAQSALDAAEQRLAPLPDRP